MYNSYFNFSCSPFENTLDQRFLFLSESHEEAIAALLYFVKEKKSFALVCGDVGTGKTMIVHHLLGKLPGSVQSILIPYPDVEYIEILRYIARVLNVNPKGKGVLDLADEVKAALTKASLDGRQVVLIIDEAHLLSIGSLEHVRLLSNIEITENKLLQILLIGQNELSQKLRRKEMRQLRQRINVNRFLSPMSPSETIEYIDHRLGVAGSSFDKCFESACKKLIYKMTGGVPRSINRLCDTALLICMSEKRDKVTGLILKKAHDALHSGVIPAPQESKSGRFFSVEKLKPALAGGALGLLLALGFMGYNGNLGENLTGAEEKSASSSMPGLLTPQPSSSAQQSSEFPAKYGDKKIDTASPSVEESGPNSAPPGESLANDQNSNADRQSTQSQREEVDEKITAKGGNPNADAQNLQTGGKSLRLRDAFTITVQKGDTLSGIAAKWFSENQAYGQKSILSANPGINDKNMIHARQILRIPKSRETDSEKK